MTTSAQTWTTPAERKVRAMEKSEATGLNTGTIVRSLRQLVEGDVIARSAGRGNPPDTGVVTSIGEDVIAVLWEDGEATCWNRRVPKGVSGTLRRPDEVLTWEHELRSHDKAACPSCP